MLTIITRFSRREGFTKCYNSIHSERAGVRHLVTCQTDEDEAWLRQYPGIKILRVPKVDLLRWGARPKSMLDSSRYYSPYNFHLTIAMHQVETEWMGFLDDDDKVIPGKLSQLVCELQEVEKGNWAFAQVLVPYDTGLGGNELPNDELFARNCAGTLPIQWCNLCGIGMFLRREHVKHSAYGDLSGADYDTALNLFRNGCAFSGLMNGPYFQIGEVGDGNHQFGMSYRPIP